MLRGRPAFCSSHVGSVVHGFEFQSGAAQSGAFQVSALGLGSAAASGGWRAVGAAGFAFAACVLSPAFACGWPVNSAESSGMASVVILFGLLLHSFY
ncbi:MAG: hypothetical protein HKK67_07295 [Chlorobiaceae bacterium]|nr:hypothetical protein [Chlorobiaceae bacterium]